MAPGGFIFPLFFEVADGGDSDAEPCVCVQVFCLRRALQADCCPYASLGRIPISFARGGCELLCLEIWFLLCLGVHSGEEEVNSGQKSFQMSLEILFEELRLAS